MPQGSDTLTAFVARWRESGAAERANCQLFLGELCDALGVERPHPTQPDDAQNAYVFERAVTFQNPDGTTSPGRIDLYKRGCFVLEAKQGSDPARAESAPLYTSVLKAKVIEFNGGLFEEAEALPLDEAQLDLLIAARRDDWRDVEPPIFGTLPESALDPRVAAAARL